MKLRLSALTVAACLGLSACNTRGGCVNEVPARLVDPTPESRAELQQVVSAALEGAEVSLAGDALMQDGELVVAQQPQRDLQQGRIMGRDLGKPERFRLQKCAAKCVLVRIATGESWVLRQASCIVR